MSGKTAEYVPNPEFINPGLEVESCSHLKVEVSYRGYPQFSSILMGFSLTSHPAIGVPAILRIFMVICPALEFLPGPLAFETVV